MECGALRKFFHLRAYRLFHAEDIVLRRGKRGIDVPPFPRHIHTRDGAAAARRCDKHIRRIRCAQEIRCARNIAHGRRQRYIRLDARLLRRQAAQYILRRLVRHGVRLGKRSAEKTAHDASRLRRKARLYIREVKPHEDIEAGEIDDDHTHTGEISRRAHHIPQLFLHRTDDIVLLAQDNITQLRKHAAQRGSLIEAAQTDQRSRDDENEIAASAQKIHTRIKRRDFLGSYLFHTHLSSIKKAPRRIAAPRPPVNR